MNTTIDTTIESPWWRTAVQGLTLACGLALAVGAVIAAGASNESATARTVSVEGIGPQLQLPSQAKERSYVFIVGSPADAINLERALNELVEGSMFGAREASIVVAEKEEALRDYLQTSNDTGPDVAIIDLRSGVAGSSAPPTAGLGPR